MFSNPEHADRTAVIVGAGGTLGSALTEAFHKSYPVVAVYRNRLPSAHERVTPLHADLADPLSSSKICDAVPGDIGALIINAGTNEDRLLVNESVARLEAAIDSFVSAPRRIIRTFGKRLRGGHVVLIGSAVGIRGARGQSVYAAVKGALIGLMYELAPELAIHDTRINTIVPGVFASSMTAAMNRTAYDSLVNDNLLRREQSPDDVARFAVQLGFLSAASCQVFSLDSRPLAR
ncbi:MAG: SDR family oxidoreductase [Spirochaetes bacterium]|nr:SDR family oxidoreductase [Spirochaetota bacterium]